MLPNFLVIGAAKSGTTALYYHLKSHPQIFMSPIKEPAFFAMDGRLPDYSAPPGVVLPRRHLVTVEHEYRALFEGVTTERAIGEASPYLGNPQAAERIRRTLPDVRLVAVLRNPIDRAYSNYLHQVRDGVEPCTDFRDALEAEEGRIRANWSPFWHYKGLGFYHHQLRAYFERFDRRQIRVHLYDDFVADPSAVMRDLFTFLDVDPAFEPDVTRRYNESGVPNNRKLYAWIRKPFRYGLVPNILRTSSLAQRAGTLLHQTLLSKPRIAETTRGELKGVFRSDILALQELLGRDLSAWL